MVRVVLLLGTNLGDKKENLEKAIRLIETAVGTVLQQSSIFITPPWGFASSNEFYNQVFIVESSLKPFDLLDAIQQNEKELGRIQKTDALGYQDRVIDIDILFYDDLVLETQRLTIPHPHLHKRRFTMEPLNEILPEFIHPVLKSDISALLKKCSDISEVHKWEA